MACKPVLNIDALAELGTEKLAKIVLDEAERNGPFKRLVSAALASAKGPEAVAKLVDRRLSALERARSFIEWDKAKAFEHDLSATVGTIIDELGEASPDMAIDRLLRFIATHESVFDRVDDSIGRVQDVYYTAIEAMGDLAEQLKDDERRLLPDRIMSRLGKSTHGYPVDVVGAVAEHIPDDALKCWDELLAVEQQRPEQDDGNPDWYRHSQAAQLRFVRQAIADARGDLDGLIALEASKHRNLQDTIGIAERLLEAGRAKDALEWVREESRPGFAYMSASDLADGGSPDDPTLPRRSNLEARILEALGDKAAAQALRWAAFENTLNVEILRDYVGKLADFEEFDALDRAFAHALKAQQRYAAFEFFLRWPRLDHAAKLVIDNHREWDGRHYHILVPVAEALEVDHPLATTILYRALLHDILARGKSKAYGHGGRYLGKLDRLASQTDAAASQSAGIDSHAAYRATLRKSHGRKAGFWALAPAEK